MKYQFCIRFDKIDVNSSASKAVLDCNAIFSKLGYEDYTITVDDNTNKKHYYPKLIKEVFRFFLNVKRNSLVGIQYPLLSINSVFKYFIRMAKLKNVKFFCVVHDLESLRTGGKDQQYIKSEIDNLNRYDMLIVHNPSMMDWLKEAGVTKPMHSLVLFDYLSQAEPPIQRVFNTDVVYAGNLTKSTFIYNMPAMTGRNLVVYGPGPKLEKLAKHTKYRGVFNPEKIVTELRGGFGLIWDGTDIEQCDEILGNYLIYNNPHKASLYIAAGLPLIAPGNSAIGKLITDMNIGILVDSLIELETLEIDEVDYANWKQNVLALREKVTKGRFFSDAVLKTEQILTAQLV